MRANFNNYYVFFVTPISKKLFDIQSLFRYINIYNINFSRSLLRNFFELSQVVEKKILYIDLFSIANDSIRWRSISNTYSLFELNLDLLFIIVENIHKLNIIFIVICKISCVFFYNLISENYLKRLTTKRIFAIKTLNVYETKK